MARYFHAEPGGFGKIVQRLAGAGYVSKLVSASVNF
jgi:hypothetical protein